MSEDSKENTPLVTNDVQLPVYTAGEESSMGSTSGLGIDDRSETVRTFNRAVDSIMAPSLRGSKRMSHVSWRTQRAGNVGLVDRKKKKKKKNRGILLNYDSAMELECQVQVNLIKHNLAAIHFRSRQFWLFTITQGLLTMIASVLAFVASSSLIDEMTKDIIATIVGSISGVVVFLQTMAGVCDYGARAAMHGSAAIDLRDLRDHIILIKFKVKKEEEQGILGDSYDEEMSKASGNKSHMGKSQDEGEDSDSESEDEEEKKKEQEHDNTFARIQQRYRQSLSGCKSNVPMALSEAFHGLQSNILVSGSLDNHRVMVDVYGPNTNYRNIIRFKAFDILASEILNSWGFPIFLPHSHRVVERAMNRLNEKLIKSHRFWDHRLDEHIADFNRDRAQETDQTPEHLRQSTTSGFHVV